MNQQSAVLGPLGLALLVVIIQNAESSYPPPATTGFGGGGELLGTEILSGRLLSRAFQGLLGPLWSPDPLAAHLFFVSALFMISPLCLLIQPVIFLLWAQASWPQFWSHSQTGRCSYWYLGISTWESGDALSRKRCFLPENPAQVFF